MASTYRRGNSVQTTAATSKHWRRIRTNNPLERILREIRRRTRVVRAFPDGQSALNLAAARLRHIAGTAWSTKRYLNIELLKDQQIRGVMPIRLATTSLAEPRGHRPSVKCAKDSVRGPEGAHELWAKLVTA